ncbi:MAG: pyridoxamine 5'-phosphate oxidase family protein [Pseudomonadales bacterium]|jgi:nitroimidazol reductase NimA-like FMN-containing flavoprotein (pyridoxamine 5'-phosphate oxidase superfamily)|nr:pyridoxamine 5'-phosphate oxidase family protein [Pseudomonadales bacterium]
MSRRDQIKMTDDEIADYLRSSRTIILVSNGKDGFPHPMPMWYCVDDDNTIYMTTFRKSQKINNLKRDPKVALLVESGDAYPELKSVLIYTEVELLDDVEATRDILFNISVQRGDLQSDAAESVREGMMNTAAKRIGMKFTPNRIITWDHSKLGGTY